MRRGGGFACSCSFITIDERHFVLHASGRGSISIISDRTGEMLRPSDRPLRTDRARVHATHGLSPSDRPSAYQELQFTADEEKVNAVPGTCIYISPGAPHAIVAVEPTVMLLTLLRPER